MSSDTKKLWKGVLPGILMVFAIWGILWLDEGLDLNLYEYGVRPRTVEGIKGIFIMPFLHGDWEHALSNSIPLIVLMGCLFLIYTKIAWESLLWMYLITGLWTWVFGRTSYHIGASGIIYALVTFLFFCGVLRRDRVSLTISLLVTFLYGSLIWGILPIFGTNISWEGHLAGALSGLAVAFFFYKTDRVPKRVLDDDDTYNEMRFGEGYWKSEAQKELESKENASSSSEGPVRIIYTYKQEDSKKKGPGN